MTAQRTIEGFDWAAPNNLSAPTPADAMRLRLAAMKRARQAVRQSKGMRS